MGTFCSLMMAPVWSAVTKAAVEKDMKWIKKINKIINYILYFVIVSQIVLTILLQFVIKIWLGDNAIIVDYCTAIIFAIFGVIYSYNILITIVANGIGELKTQFKYYLIGVIIKLPVVLILNYLNFSWLNVIICNIIILVLFCYNQNR